MEEMSQRKVLGISLMGFAVLMLTVCFIYQIITPSVEFVNIWFSYLVGAVLLVIGLLMAFVKNAEQPPDR
jgi:multisubunit Na+/H+ antiporter MnhE subunit